MGSTFCSGRVALVQVTETIYDDRENAPVGEAALAAQNVTSVTVQARTACISKRYYASGATGYWSNSGELPRSAERSHSNGETQGKCPVQAGPIQVG